MTIHDVLHRVNQRYIEIRHEHLGHKPITRWTWAGLARASRKSEMYMQILDEASKAMSQGLLQLAT